MDAVEKVLRCFADEKAKGHDLPVDPVQNRLQVVSLARILAVEEVEKTEHERLVKVLLRYLGVNLNGMYWPGRPEGRAESNLTIVSYPF